MIMTQGTISVLIGCHSIVHSIYVVRAWKILYGSYPRLWEMICIFLHDVGHIGLQYLDSHEQKKKHWNKGAWIAWRLFGEKGYRFIAGHCLNSGWKLSKLYKADKYSWYIASKYWQFLNTITEPALRRGMGRWDAVYFFQDQVKQNIESGEYKSTHELYLERQ